MPDYVPQPRRPTVTGGHGRGRSRRFTNAMQRPGSDGSVRVELTNADHFKSPVLKIITAAGTHVLNTNDFGKVVITSTNDKFITLPDPVGNAGETFQFIQTTTRNTTLQCVNATAAKFGSTADSAINSLRVNTYGDWLMLISSGLDWLTTPLGNTVNTLTKNVPTSF